MFQKVKIPILNHAKNSFQVSYDLYQEKTLTFDLVFNIMTAKAANLPENAPTSKKVVCTHMERGGQHQIVVLRDHMEPSLMDSTRTFNRYMIMTRRPYLTKESA